MILIRMLFIAEKQKATRPLQFSFVDLDCVWAAIHFISSFFISRLQDLSCPFMSVHSIGPNHYPYEISV